MADALTTRYQLTKPEVGQSTNTWGGKVNTDQDSIDTFLGIPRAMANAPAVGGTTTLDMSVSTYFDFTLTQAIATLNITNVPVATLPGGQPAQCRLVLRITNGGAFAITWPNSVTWVRTAAPILQVAGVDVIEMVTDNGGTNWYAWRVDQPLTRHSRATTSGNITINNGTNILTWDTNDASDVGGLRPGGSPTKIVIPAGWETGAGIQIFGGLAITGGSFSSAYGASALLTIRKNGVTTPASTLIEKTLNSALGAQIQVYDPAPVVTDYWEFTLTPGFAPSGGEVVSAAPSSFFSALQVRP